MHDRVEAAPSEIFDAACFQDSGQLSIVENREVSLRWGDCAQPHNLSNHNYTSVDSQPPSYFPRVSKPLAVVIFSILAAKQLINVLDGREGKKRNCRKKSKGQQMYKVDLQPEEKNEGKYDRN